MVEEKKDTLKLTGVYELKNDTILVNQASLYENLTKLIFYNFESQHIEMLNQLMFYYNYNLKKLYNIKKVTLCEISNNFLDYNQSQTMYKKIKEFNINFLDFLLITILNLLH